MNIEEKAKRYDEAIKRAKSLYDNNQPISGSNVIINNIFPELKESEDEQHRKWILEYLYDGLRKSDEQFKGQFKAAIAWLEQQGNLMKALQISNSRIAELVEEKYNLEEKLKKQGEQKPVWSEEDEITRKALINLVEMYYGGGFDKTEKNRLLNYLKSIRPQNHWKPTTEQLRELRCVISGCSFETSILVELEENLKKLL